MKDIKELIDKLERGPRMGEAVDEPEGVRYVQMSDTFVKELIEFLNNIEYFE